MAIKTENLYRKLFDNLSSQGFDPHPKSATTDKDVVPEEADYISFDYDVGNELAEVELSVEKNDSGFTLVVYTSDATDNAESPTDWGDLLPQIRNVAKRCGIRGFKIRNRNHLHHDLQKRQYMKRQEQISEGYYPMGKAKSYSDAVPSVKIVIEHTRQIEEGEQRFRNINRIFLENEQGERILAPTTRPGIARVYARHIAEGGLPHDDKWNHIKGLCEEYNKMAGFVRATRNGQFNESTQQLIAEGVNHYQKLRESLGRLTTHRGYNAYFESWTPSLMEDDTDTTTVNELFVQETMDPRIESAMPILAKLSKNISEMSEVSELAEWADSLVEGGGGGEASEEPVVPMTNEEESLTSNNPVGIPEGRLDGGDDIDSPVASAITNRILRGRIDLLAKYGPEKVSDAIAQVADYVGDFFDDEEIGSSDVSGWVRQVEQLLADPLEEGERPGLWANIHAKRERIKHGSGEKMRKPGSKGAPTAQNFRDAAKEDVEEGLAGAALGGVAGAALTKSAGGAMTGANLGSEIQDELTQESLADDYEDMSDRELMRHAGMLGLEKNCVPDEEGGLANRREIIYLLQKEAEGDLDEGILDTIKKGAKAVGKAIVGPDDDELLADLKKKAGVRNPETGKPSMAHSDVEKVDEDEFAGDYKTGPEGQWRNKGPKANKPATIGDLVGASESSEPKKEMLEGQEDLDAILRIIKK